MNKIKILSLLFALLISVSYALIFNSSAKASNVVDTSGFNQGGGYHLQIYMLGNSISATPTMQGPKLSPVKWDIYFTSTNVTLMDLIYYCENKNLGGPSFDYWRWQCTGQSYSFNFNEQYLGIEDSSSSGEVPDSKFICFLGVVDGSGGIKGVDFESKTYSKELYNYFVDMSTPLIDLRALSNDSVLTLFFSWNYNEIIYNYSSDLQTQLDYAYQNGYQQGLSNGSSINYENGYNVGYENGYNVGYENGFQEINKSDLSSGFLGLFTSVVSVPINILNGLFSAEFFGIPIVGVLISFLLISIIIWLIKRVLL